MDYQTPLSQEEREQILSELHRRELLEKQALAQQKEVREAEAERQYRQEVAAAAAKAEAERMERLRTDLGYSLAKLTEALEVLQQGDETKCYRLLAGVNPNINLVMQRLNQKPTVMPSAGVPTVKIKADNPLGFALINSVDFIQGVHQLYEEDAQ